MSVQGIQTLYVQVQGNIASQMGEETVLLSVENGKYYNLGEVGGSIWKAVATPTTFEEIVSQMLAEYEVSEEECKEQVLAFLDELLAENLIQYEQKED